MIFTSVIFLLFFVVTYSLYWLIPYKKGKDWILLLASFVFYASWSVPFFFHLFFLLVINYVFIKILWKRKSGWILSVILILDVGNLVVFKYLNFIGRVLSDLGWQSGSQEIHSLHIILPLAISFYTFQVIAFAVDVYRGQVDKLPSPFYFLLFILFFPQLVAGPIMRTTDLLPQLQKPKWRPNFVNRGAVFLISGIAKKVLIADNLAYFIDPVWANPTQYDWISIWLAAHGFVWQIYCDFSGYSDIALGCAYLLGFSIPRNFKAPFFATSIRDFWNNWHITLSSWLRDYVYIPLGGNRGGKWHTYKNLIITFGIGGFWHGANWTFLIWGLFHGFLLASHRMMRDFGGRFLPQGKIWIPFAALCTYMLFLISMVVFRVDTLEKAFLIFRLGFTSTAAPYSIDVSQVVSLIFGGLVLHSWEAVTKIPKLLLAYQRPILIFLGVSLFFLVSAYAGLGQQFIYFQF